MTVYLICCCSVANGGSNAAGDAAAETSDGKCVRYKDRYTAFLFFQMLIFYRAHSYIINIYASVVCTRV